MTKSSQFNQRDPLAMPDHFVSIVAADQHLPFDSLLQFAYLEVNNPCVLMLGLGRRSARDRSYQRLVSISLSTARPFASGATAFSYLLFPDVSFRRRSAQSISSLRNRAAFPVGVAELADA
jgi:hypothetical protein